jgi:hypothetical protein
MISFSFQAELSSRASVRGLPALLEAPTRALRSAGNQLNGRERPLSTSLLCTPMSSSLPEMPAHRASICI